LAGAVFIYLLFFSPSRETSFGVSHPAVGKSISRLALAPLTGTEKRVRLEDLKGKVVLINYWGTWCGPCRMEFPQLAALETSLRSEPEFLFLSVSCGNDPEGEEESELAAATKEFLREAKADLPTYYDPDAISRRALVMDAQLEGFSFPTTVLLDRQGIIRALWPGYADIFEREMQLAVRKVLAEK
jgi:cytochrome c biogenesis protein CcmG/thiol:disulfide interchange protein DsbE